MAEGEEASPHAFGSPGFKGVPSLGTALCTPTSMKCPEEKPEGECCMFSFTCV